MSGQSKETMLLIDADSLVYSCSYGVESETEAYYKFDMHIQDIVESISECFFVDSIIIYHGNKGNFRLNIDSEYKANRKGKEKPVFYTELSEYVKTSWESTSAIDEEVDDLIAKHWKYYHDEACINPIIVSIDKDYQQLPALIFNYSERKRGFYQATEAEAKRNFWTQVITGDAADNVNYLKGKGIKFAEKELKDCKTEFQYLRRIYPLFKEEYGDEARDKLWNCYELLKIG